jgi:hypothetical protein
MLRVIAHPPSLRHAVKETEPRIIHELKCTSRGSDGTLQCLEYAYLSQIDTSVV